MAALALSACASTPDSGELEPPTTVVTGRDSTSFPATAPQPAPNTGAVSAPPGTAGAPADRPGTPPADQPDLVDPAPSIDPSTIVASSSWGVCRLLAPSKLPGIGGSDLGFSFLAPAANAAKGAADQLVFLFGDTWTQATDACFYAGEPSDDLQATMPAERPAVLQPGEPVEDAVHTCADLKIASDDPDSHHAWRAIRLFSDPSRAPEAQLKTGFLSAPVTGFADGKHAFGVFLRGVPAHCANDSECPSDTRCSLQTPFMPSSLGECTGTRSEAGTPPTYCIAPSRCSDGSVCGFTATGVCLADPFGLPSGDGTASEAPDWYQRDPRRAILVQLDIAAALWPDRPEDYAVGHRFATNKFVNAVARTVAHFDPDKPESNDYRPGHHTLLMWGRPAFWTSGGAQAPLFLLYQPLDGLVDAATGKIDWQPRFFAGYDAATGQPRWSQHERDALPVYGDAGGAPEFDLVSHGAMTWIEPLKRWVMFYGGSVPEWIRADRATGVSPPIANEQPLPGAIHMRTAAHPWGRATLTSPVQQAWTRATPVLVQQELADLLTCERPGAVTTAGCTVPRTPFELISEVVDWASETTPDDWRSTAGACLLGNYAFASLYSLAGSDTPHLYGANIIDAWTDDVTTRLTDLAPDERAVELYWNVSTWNPYQVVLLKTQLRARPF